MGRDVCPPVPLFVRWLTYLFCCLVLIHHIHTSIHPYIHTNKVPEAVRQGNTAKAEQLATERENVCAAIESFQGLLA